MARARGLGPRGRRFESCFPDVSALNGGLIQTQGMPLFHATYLAERFNCVPSTDNLGLMYGYEGWCQTIGQNMGLDFEKVRTKVDLPFDFLDKLPLDFVEKSREEGKGRLASVYLDQKWGEIRQSHDLKKYQKAVADYEAVAANNFQSLEDQHDQMINDLVIGLDNSALAGLGAFITFDLTSHLPLAIVGGISAAMIAASTTFSSFTKTKGDLKVKPLAVFLEAKKKVKNES